MSLETINSLFVEHLPGDGQKIMFIHGAGGGSWYWLPFMKFYNQRGFDCYAINLRGHAPNTFMDNIGGISIYDYIDDVSGVLDEIAGDQYILFGHSMGGLIAQQYTADNPNKVSDLIVIGSAPPGQVKLTRADLPRLSDRIRSHLINWGLRHVARKKKPVVPVYSVTKRYIANCIPHKEQKEFFKKLVPESSLAGIEVADGLIEIDLSDIQIPKAVVCGDLDFMSVASMQHQLAELHKANLITYPTHGHMLMMEPGWEKVAQDLLDWLNNAHQA